MKASLTVCVADGAQIAFEAQFTHPDHVIGLDSIVYHGEADLSLAVPGQCPLVSCNFENGNCGWRHIPPNFAWTNQLNLEAEDGEHVFNAFFFGEDAARAATGCVSLSAATELSFWYFTSSNAWADVRISTQSTGGSELASIIWRANAIGKYFKAICN